MSGRCGIVQKMVLVSSYFGGGYSLRFRLYLLYILLKSSSLLGYRARALIDLLISGIEFREYLLAVVESGGKVLAFATAFCYCGGVFVS